MSQPILVATFTDERALCAAARAAREAGLTIVDAYTPYAVHGLDEAMGLRPSRLTWACGLLGLSGAAFMLWFQYWTSAVSWPINVGGKPFNSLPAFVPVVFESMVLPAGLGVVLTLLVVCRLHPWRQPRVVAAGVTDDRFALVLAESDATFDTSAVRAMLAEHHPESVEERIDDSTSAPAPPADGESRGWGAVNAVLAALLILVVAILLLGPRNTHRPNLEFIPDMVHSEAYDAYQLRGQERLAAAAVLPPGTVARDEVPLHYQATEVDGALAGRELVNPLAPDDQAARTRGEYVFRQFCACCHGGSGLGDGPVAQRGYPPPPPYASGKSRDMKDGELFHIISFGRNNMPSQRSLITPADRWRVIRYLRGFQQPTSAPKATAP